MGARLVYVLVNYPRFLDDPFQIVNFYQDGVFRTAGLVLNGGVVACVIVMFFYAKWQSMPILRVYDALAPSLGLGIFLTRIGCFLEGCCYGLPTSMPWGVVFPADSKVGQYQRHVSNEIETIHPTQLYSSLYGLLIFLVLLWLDKKYKRFDGFTALVLFMLYPAARFTVEFFRRYYDETGVYLGLTHNQYLSLSLFAASLAGMVVLWRRQLRKTGAGTP